ncbi:MAG TPA: hypothetical protein VGB07_06005 [Blastocatellia bacterium]
MNHLMIAALICLALATVLGAIDGTYYHLKKYQLHLRAESRFEHQLHTIRAFLFAPIVWLLFGWNSGGWLLWLGVLAFAIDSIVELIDVLVENRSRAKLGGLSTGEYAIHVNATGLRIAAVALALAAKPVAAWSLDSPSLIEPDFPAWLSWLMFCVVGGSVIGGVQHLWLLRAKPQTASQA